MYILRRAALRTLSSAPSQSTAIQRTFVTRSPYCAATQWQSSLPQRRWASERASPTDAQTTGETVPPEPSDEADGAASPGEAADAEETVKTEPSPEEQESEIVEESIATPETTDAAKSSAPAGSAAQTVRNAASRMADGARSAASAVGNAADPFSPRGARDRSSDMPPPPPSKIIYVGNLFFEATAAQLEQEFKPFGTVVNTKIATGPNGMSKGFGYVEYDDVDSAATAIRNLDQKVFQGRRLAVQYHVRRQPATTRPHEPSPPSKTLFIGNLSFQMSDKDLNDLFRPIRNVQDVRVAIDRRSGQPRGFAHADFVDEESAAKAKALLENKTVYGRHLRIDYTRKASYSDGAEEGRRPGGDRRRPDGNRRRPQGEERRRPGPEEDDD